MHIGTLARLCGTSPKAIRHYESLGLLGPVARRGAYRVFSAANLRQARLIRRALALGLRLADLPPVLADGDTPDWPALRGLLAQRRGEIEADLARLRQLLVALDAVEAELDACPDSPPATACATPAQASDA